MLSIAMASLCFTASVFAHSITDIQPRSFKRGTTTAVRVYVQNTSSLDTQFEMFLNTKPTGWTVDASSKLFVVTGSATGFIEFQVTSPGAGGAGSLGGLLKVNDAGTWKDVMTAFIPVSGNEANLGLSAFTFGPTTLLPGSHPTSLGWSLKNSGINDISGNKVRYTAYLSKSSSFDASAFSIGSFDSTEYTTAGQTQVGLSLAADALLNFTIPASASGAYYIYWQVAHQSPSTLTDSDTADNTTLYGDTISVQKLAAPTVDASDGDYDDYILVSWTPVAGATGYKLFENVGSPDFATATCLDPNIPSATNQVKVLNPAIGELRYYWVQPFATAGANDGDVGGPDSGYGRLLPPGGVSATDGTYADKIRVSWSPVAGASSYEVWRSPDGTNGWVMVAPSVPQLYYDDYVSMSSPLYYFVKAVSGAIQSDSSNIDAGAIAEPYTVSYHANGAMNGTAPAPQTKVKDVPLILASNTGSLKKTGFVFMGWNTLANGSGTSYAEGGSYTTNVAVTLYAKWLLADSGDIADAVDAPSLTWTLGGNSNWFLQTATTHDGIDAAQSGDINDSEQSSMQTAVSGPGTIYFWWKVSSESNYDKLRVYLDDVEQPGAISGEVAWQQMSILIPSGHHTVKWVYTKDGSVSTGLDCGWVDQVVWTPGQVTLSPVYRFWSPIYRGHFYTISEDEKNQVIATMPREWRYEGIAYYAYKTSAPDTIPVYRFWSVRYRAHFYTISESEKNNTITNLSKDWSYEGIAYYACATPITGTLPVYRFWSSWNKHHFYTISESEKKNVVETMASEWTYENVAYYAFPAVSRSAFVGASIQETNEALNERTLTSAEPSSFDLETFSGASGGGTNRSGDFEKSGIQLARTSVFGDIVFPLSYLGCNVAAYVYDSVVGAWQCVLPATNSPASLVLENIQPDRSYTLEVFAGDPADGELVSVHRSSFEMQLDAPASIHEAVASQAVSDGVGSPVMRLAAPSVDGTQSIKLYSSSQGVVQTLTGVTSGETVDLAVPEWNTWYWVSGLQESDNGLVLSIWLRHQTEE